jgi:hypothetical protein
MVSKQDMYNVIGKRADHVSERTIKYDSRHRDTPSKFDHLLCPQFAPIN